MSTRKTVGANRELLLSIIESSDDAIISIDLGRVITSWNNGAERLFGYTQEEAMGQNISLIVPRDRLEEEDGIIEKITRGERVQQYETQRIDKSQGLHFISLSVSPIRDSLGRITGASKVLRDISDRKRLEAQVQAKSNELIGVFDRITEGFIMLDHDFRYVYANRKIGTMIGQDPSSLLGKCVWDLFPEAVGSATYDAFQEALRENRYVANTDYYAPLDLWQENHIYPGPEGLSVFIRDITEQKKVELRLKESEAIYKSIAAGIPGSVICLFDKDYRYTLIEGDMLQKIGYIKEALLGQRISDILIPSIYREFLEGLKRVFAGESFSREIRRGDYDFVSRFVPLRDKEGTIFSAMVVSIDVTELKNAQRHINNLNETLEWKVAERTEELASVNRELEAFVYSVSHDLRAPLRIIDGFADILSSDYGDALDEEGKRTVAVIVSSARRMGQLIDDLLNLSRQGRQELVTTAVDMNRLVDSVVQEQLASASAKATVTNDDLLPAVCDERLIRQVWINLVSNALKYSSGKPEPRIHITSFRHGRMATYSIRDNGVGFNMNYAHKLFGIFQRLHKPSEFEGTGVGLALVQRIVHRHGGKVWAEAKEGEGATFFFTIPGR